jgi:NRAMP (natural resistance-associated macrophage protein)-like metal ion transporter
MLGATADAEVLMTTDVPARQGEDAAARQEEAGRSTWHRLSRSFGPGLVTGASDDDPSGIATYAQAGAQFRNGTLWTVLFCLPLMMAIQEICDRTALATGQNLGELARVKYRRAGRGIVMVLLVALLVANAFNVAADLMAIGQGMQLLHAGSATLWAALAGVTIMMLLATGSFEKIALVFKILCLTLLAYVGVLFAVKVSWGDVGRGLSAQQLNSGHDYWAMIVAILGTTLSPYLFFWQSAHRVEELRDEDLGGTKASTLDERSKRGRRHKVQEARLDVFTGMLFSELVMFAIIVATAATLGAKKGTKIDSAAAAAKALEPIAGHLSTVLFAAGFIGSGLLAVPVLAGSASTGIAGLRGKRWGFERGPRKAPLFYALVALGTVGGVVLSIFYHDPIGLLVLSALVNGVAAAPFMVIVMLISGDRDLMGKDRNGRLARTLGWAATVAMSVAGVVGLYQTLTPG